MRFALAPLCRWLGAGSLFNNQPLVTAGGVTMSPHILALDAAGAPHRWINARGAALYYATNMVAWEIGSHEFVLRGGSQRATGLRSVIRASSIIAIKGRNFM
jgi:hypothetical protein